MDDQDYYSLDNIHVDNLELNDDFLNQIQQLNNSNENFYNINNANLNLILNTTATNNNGSNNLNDECLNSFNNCYLTPPLSNASNNANSNYYNNSEACYLSDADVTGGVCNYNENCIDQSNNNNYINRHSDFHSEQHSVINFLQPNLNNNVDFSSSYNNLSSSLSITSSSSLSHCATEDESTSRSSSSIFMPSISINSLDKKPKDKKSYTKRLAHKDHKEYEGEDSEEMFSMPNESGEKPPHPYADIIVKAILSTNENQIQLKDIYKYMIENYEYFASQADSNKWRNSVRHNLSRHKYFQKTTTKNSSGYFWSIHPAYFKYLKNGCFNSKDIKKLKINSEKPKRTTLSSKNKKKTDILKNSSDTSSSTSFTNSDNSFIQTQFSSTHSSSSPLSASKSSNNTFINDSAYQSFSECNSETPLNYFYNDQNTISTSKYKFLDLPATNSNQSDLYMLNGQYSFNCF